MLVVLDAKTLMLQSVSESVGLAIILDLWCDVHGGVTIKSPSCLQLIGFRPFDDVSSVEQLKTASSSLNTTTFSGVFVRAPSATGNTDNGNLYFCTNIQVVDIIILQTYLGQQRRASDGQQAKGETAPQYLPKFWDLLYARALLRNKKQVLHGDLTNVRKFFYMVDHGP